MNVATLMAVTLLFSAAVVVIQQVYILIQWRRAIHDERYILHMECELQYYRSLDATSPMPIIEHEENYHAGFS